MKVNSQASINIVLIMNEWHEAELFQRPNDSES